MSTPSELRDSLRTAIIKWNGDCDDGEIDDYLDAVIASLPEPENETTDDDGFAWGQRAYVAKLVKLLQSAKSTSKESE